MEMERPAPEDLLAIFQRVRTLYYSSAKAAPVTLDMPLQKFGRLPPALGVIDECMEGVESYLRITIPKAKKDALPKDATLRDFFTLVSQYLELPRIHSPEDAWPAFLLQLQKHMPKNQWPSPDEPLMPKAICNYESLQRAIIILSRGRVYLPQRIYPRWTKKVGVLSVIGFFGAWFFIVLGLGGAGFIIVPENLVPAAMVLMMVLMIASLATGLLIARIAEKMGQVRLDIPWTTFAELSASLARSHSDLPPRKKLL